MATNCLLHHKEFKRSPSVEKFRNSIRKHYKEKLKEGRNKELFKRRALFHTTVKSLHQHLPIEEKNLLQQDLPNLDQILEEFEEIEKEINQSDLQSEVAQYNMYLESETNAFLESLPIVTCSWCNAQIQTVNKIGDEEICDSCTQSYFKIDNTFV